MLTDLAVGGKRVQLMHVPLRTIPLLPLLNNKSCRAIPSDPLPNQEIRSILQNIL